MAFNKSTGAPLNVLISNVLFFLISFLFTDAGVEIQHCLQPCVVVGFH